MALQWIGHMQQPADTAELRQRVKNTIDRRNWAEVEPELDHAVAEIRTDPLLMLAKGRALAMRGVPNEALPWFLDALALAGDDKLLAARAGFEAGCIYLGRGEHEAAQAVCAAAIAMAGQDDLADLLHLRALLAEQTFAHQQALEHYRAATSASGGTLSPVTLVLAIRNQSGLLVHDRPREAVALAVLAQELHARHDIDRRLRPSMLNTHAYALICLGELAQAAEIARRAVVLADQFSQLRIGIFARFNIAIVEELCGDMAAAELSLREVKARARDIAAADMVMWACLRGVWLRLLARDAEGAEAALNALEPIGDPYRRTAETLRALLAGERHDLQQASHELHRLASSYTTEYDNVTSFVLLLWAARYELQAGHRRLGRATFSAAVALQRESGLRMSPNWWAAELRYSSRELADATCSRCVDSLAFPSTESAPPQPPVVLLTEDGQIFLDGQPVACRQRTGRLVLQRLTAMLANAHPMPLSRTHLADRLWPDSEGDAAVRNLYGATNDLRRLLCQVPGLRLVVDRRGYRIELDSNVRMNDPHARN